MGKLVQILTIRGEGCDCYISIVQNHYSSRMKNKAVTVTKLDSMHPTDIMDHINYFDLHKGVSHFAQGLNILSLRHIPWVNIQTFSRLISSMPALNFV